VFEANRYLTRVVAASLLASSLVMFPLAPNAYSTVGDSDTALAVNGSSQYVGATSDASTFDIANAISIEAWIYATGASCTGNIVGKATSYFLYCVSGILTYAMGGASSWSGVGTGIRIPTNEWHHIALTRAANTATAKVYFNGNLLYTGTADGAGTAALTNSSNLFNIGARNGAATFFAGQIDEVRLYNSEISEAQVKTDMYAWGPTNTSGLVAYYDFNDVSGSSITNKVSSPGANTTLTAYSSPTYSNVESSTVVNGEHVVTFPRSYLVANGGWKIPNHVSTIKSLVVAGGGGGGSRAGGGGGAGGYVYDAALSVTANSYQSIVVGQGGSGWSYLPGYNGTNSSLGTLRTALGGGGGGHADGSNNTTRDGRNGGSGGGAGGSAFAQNSSATQGLGNQNSTYGYGVGNRGGSGYSNGAWPSGGGGGASGVGANANGGTNTAGKGGTGISDPIGGSSICYATGGGGGVLAGYTKGDGGDCGGVASPNNNSGIAGSSLRGAPSARANTGSGGAGNGYNASGADYEGGNGASGVIVLRYALFSDVSLTFSGGTQAAFRGAGTITATANQAGRVTFYERGKVIPGCKNKPTNGSLVATCTWRPSTRGNVSISATNRPTNSFITNASTSLSVFVTNRTGARA
jgi:hypothetical protein